MSGGHWNYVGQNISAQIAEIGIDPQVIKRFKIIPQLLIFLGNFIEKIEHELDWDLSCDTPIEDDGKWEREILEILHDANFDISIAEMLNKKL